MKDWQINRETALYLSASSMPSQFGVSIYNELFRRLGVNAIYLAREATDAGLLAAAIRTLAVRGCSLSMPLKNGIVSHLDEVDDEASSVQSVNTVLNTDGKLSGYNTDIDGAREVLRSLEPRAVLVYGSGSVTDSVLLVLTSLGIDDVRMKARNPSALAEKAKRWNHSEHNGEPFDLFINATPMSLRPIDPAMLELLRSTRPRVFDLVVPQKENYLARACTENDLAYVSGFAMYKHQFVRQFQLYTGITVAPETVEEIARQKALI